MFSKRSRGTLNQSNVEILARTRAGKMHVWSFTYVFTGTKMYNTDVFSAFKRTKLTYRPHLNINPYKY